MMDMKAVYSFIRNFARNLTAALSLLPRASKKNWVHFFPQKTVFSVITVEIGPRVLNNRQLKHFRILFHLFIIASFL